jgi:beta-N-acetylhexosaminidase
MARRTAPADLLRAGALLLTVIVTAGCSGGRHPASPDTARRGVAEQAPSPSGPGPVIPAPQPTAVQRADVDAQIAAMPLDREVGQVFMTYTYGRTATDDDATSVAANETLSGVRDGAELISRYHVGGLLLLDTNPLDNRQPTVETGTTDPNVTAGYTASMQAAAAAAGDPPLLIGVDQEGGTVQRLSKPFPRFPEQALLGRQSDGVSLAQAQGTHLGQQLLPLGVDINFAPVADVLTNPADSAIGTRAFGTTASVVSPRVAAEVRGLGGAGVAATLKHFPGHGSTGVDSHIGLPVVTRSLAELQATDLPPFQAGIDAGAPLVMLGHLLVPAIDPNLPASLSSATVHLLRDQLHFDGVIVTDGLFMGALFGYGSPDQIAVQALRAGVDLLLQPRSLATSVPAVEVAVRSGALPKSRIDDAVRHLLLLKQRLAAD